MNLRPHHIWRNHLAPHAIALLSGVLLSLCFPGWNISGLVWIWCAPLMVLLWKRQKDGFKLGISTGLGFWLCNSSWLLSIHEIPEVPSIAAIAAWLSMSSYLSLYFGLWGYLVTKFANPWEAPVPTEATASKGSSSIEKKIQDKLKKKKPQRQSGFLTSIRILRFATIHAGLWVGLEWLRGIGPLAFGWNGLGVAFHDTPMLAQSAEWIGVTGLAFTPMFISSIIVQTGKRLFEEARDGKFKAHWEVGVGVGLVAIQFHTGLDRIHYFTTAETQPLEIMLVQNNTKQRLNWDATYRETIYLELLRATKSGFEQVDALNLTRMQEAGEDTPFELFSPELVLWPESSIGEPLFYYSEEDGRRVGHRNQVFLQQELIDLPPFTLLSGLNEVGIDEEGRQLEQAKHYNSLALFSAESRDYRFNPNPHIQTYQKHHLVPFGETIPFKNSWVGDIYAALTGGPSGDNFTAGTSTAPIPYLSKQGTIGLIPTICFEDTVASIPRSFVRDEPQVIINVTNDGWFGESSASIQHAANSKFRCIELRRPMARAANTGLSGVFNMVGNTEDIVTGQSRAIIDENGKPFLRDQLLATVRIPKKPVTTLYAIAGDWFCYFTCTLAVLLCGWNRFSPKRY